MLALDAMRYDLVPRGIDVTVVNPGFVRTPLTDRNEFHMPMRIEAAEAAELIVRGIERRKREVHFPARFSWLMKTLRVLPYPVYEALVRRTAAR
jgi:short-subunit dehydrogenase